MNSLSIWEDRKHSTRTLPSDFTSTLWWWVSWFNVVSFMLVWCHFPRPSPGKENHSKKALRISFLKNFRFPVEREKEWKKDGKLDLRIYEKEMALITLLHIVPMKKRKNWITRFFHFADRLRLWIETQVGQWGELTTFEFNDTHENQFKNVSDHKLPSSNHRKSTEQIGEVKLRIFHLFLSLSRNVKIEIGFSINVMTNQTWHSPKWFYFLLFFYMKIVTGNHASSLLRWTWRYHVLLSYFLGHQLLRIEPLKRLSNWIWMIRQGRRELAIIYK